ncbi:translation initiation factor IF-3, putative [Plasmodium malariae]|uniref:Translation initiation factor IF-3, putative n=1 Tax=Plasmodium malariae TaxID=5858 RepID=A0A1C3KE99_PLAMA|nr:translation initiation factor IF-3, putative [Plasmodium malariae]
MLFYSYFISKSFFIREYYLRTKLHGLGKINYERYVYYHITKQALYIFLENKYVRYVSNNTYERVPKKEVTAYKSIERAEPKEVQQHQQRQEQEHIIKQSGITKKETNISGILKGEEVRSSKGKNDEMTLEDVKSRVKERIVPTYIEVDKVCNIMNKEGSINSIIYKKNYPYYNIDPSVKTKKIQIYYNCEMFDMDRKINKIKKFLLNGSPVDILLIYNSDATIRKKLNKKNKYREDENKKKHRNFSNFQTSNKITKFTESQKLKDTKYSLHIYFKINLILNHIKKISKVDEIFRHIQNSNNIILIKAYPK